MRLDKFLVECGIGSRSEVKKYLKQKRITVNGQTTTMAKAQIDEAADVICFDGTVLQYEEFVYYLLNKPKGVLSATQDNQSKTVLDLLDETAHHKQVFPVGRLDKDTHGLLLLTNNGDLAHAMLSPKKHVNKVYQARVNGVMTAEDQQRFARGISLKDHDCLPAQLEVLAIDEQNETCLVQITIQEGKFHQVKRMVKACGKEVSDLQRLSMGPLSLDADLELGKWRRLTESERHSLEVFGVDL